MATTLLSQMITDAIQNMYNPKDREYVLFLKDHKDDIMQHSEVKDITISEQYTYKYRLRKYLRSIRYPEEFDWYVLWINGWDTTMDFIDEKSIILPKSDYITTLRSLYRSDEALRKKCQCFITE